MTWEAISFTSWAFVVFLAAVLAGERVLPSRARNAFLLVASWLFYASWDHRFVFLLVLSSVIYHSSGILIHRGPLTPRERGRASAWVVGAAFLFVAVPGRLSAVARDWPLAPPPNGALFLAGVCGLVLIVNLLHSRVATLDAPRRRRVALWFAVAVNLAILAAFKYLSFFLENVAALQRAVGVTPRDLHLELALPVGISFFTFQGMTYVIDIHRKRLVPTTRLIDFALFLAFFPVVLAGPIERAARLLPQLMGERRRRPGQLGGALGLILQGLFKKAVIADGVAATANAVFGATSAMSWIDVVVGTLCFALQLYCDFSGYSDIALGVGRLLGIELTTNFRHPYFARNPADFWGRWHISLSSWFRDYVFFPLGGPSGGRWRWMRNVMLTFLVTGLWHGAAWNFVLWGLYHGALLCVHRLQEPLWESRPPRKLAWAPVSTVAFFGLVCYGWVLFRCQSLAQIASVTSTLVLDVGNLQLTAPLPPASSLLGLAVLAVAESVSHVAGDRPLDEVLPVPAWTAFYAIMIFSLILGAGAVSPQFVYFTF